MNSKKPDNYRNFLDQAVQQARRHTLNRSSQDGLATRKMSELMNVLYPEGKISSDFSTFLMIRLLDNVVRLAQPHLTRELEKDAWRDIAGCGLIGSAEGMRTDAEVDALLKQLETLNKRREGSRRGALVRCVIASREGGIGSLFSPTGSA